MKLGAEHIAALHGGHHRGAIVGSGNDLRLILRHSAEGMDKIDVSALVNAAK